MILGFSLKSFNEKYGTDDQCLEAIKKRRFPDDLPCPKCKQVSKFYRVSKRPAYACKFCGYHIYPLAGTIFEKTTTPLHYWFFAIRVMAQTRSGTSAKQLQRMLGVTYKTAWRMFKQIRLLMAQGGDPLNGIVEVDETFIGGKAENRKYKLDFNEIPKEIVMGMVQRGGKAYVKRIPTTGKWALLKQIKEHIDPKARVITDQFAGYTQLKKYGYRHEFVNHKETYVVGDIYTQNVECLWSNLKRGIYGVYRIVSKKYLQAYIDEYTFRYNHRKTPELMFDLLLRQIACVKPLQISA